MNRPPGGNGESARAAGTSAIKGALLIGLAVVIGLVLLQRIDNNKTSSASPSTKPQTTTTVAGGGSTSVPSTTTVPSTPPKTPSELKLIVLNGGAAAHKATEMSQSLRQAGYTNQDQANDWTGHTQAGNSVLCKAGLDREAVALSQQSALQGSKVEPFPDPAPPFSSDVDCVVVVGSA